MNLDGILPWLQTLPSALLANFGDVTANHPEPARSTVLYTLLTLVIALGVVKIVKGVSK